MLLVGFEVTKKIKETKPNPTNIRLSMTQNLPTKIFPQKQQCHCGAPSATKQHCLYTAPKHQTVRLAAVPVTVPKPTAQQCPRMFPCPGRGSLYY